MRNGLTACKLALAWLVCTACAPGTQISSDSGAGDGAGATGGAGASGATGGNGPAAGSGGRGGAGANGSGGGSGTGGGDAGGAGNAGGTGGGRGGAAGVAGGAGGQAGNIGGGGGVASGGAGGRGGSGGSAATGGSLGPLAPAQGALFGAFVGTGTVAQLEATLGRKLAVSHNFYGWTDDYTSWVRTALGSGYIPLVTWEAWTNSVGVSLDDIIAGAHDSMIRSRAQSCASIGQKFFMRWGHEMNGNWYPWDGAHNGANPAAAAKYVAAYRHIHDVFVGAGASNVLWVFCPNVDSVPGEAWNQWTNYYPGDAYVDWMAFDGYNWGTVQAGSSWRTFASIAGTIYPGLVGKGKPIMIAEMASAEQGGDKAAWIAGVLPALSASYPAIKAFVWFHMNKETDWRVDSSPAARGAFMTLARDPYLSP
jgi:hypothetical protein